MDQFLASRAVQYVLVFAGAGLLAVLIRFASELGEHRVAGIVAMVPMKILIAWYIVGRADGTAAIVQSTTGMFLGMIALCLCILAVRLLAPTVGFGWTIPLALAVWLVAVLTIEFTLRSRGTA